jgi:hypothetical protein
MYSVKELDEFAKKAGLSLEEIKRELGRIKEEYGISDAEAFAVLKSRIALKHIKKSLERG